jgi:hypothetical protein
LAGSHLALLAALAGAAVAAPAARAVLPAFTVEGLYRSGQPVPGLGQINSPFFSGANGGEGFRGVSINNSGVAAAIVSIYAAPGFNRAVLRSSDGVTPFLAAGAEAPSPGAVTLPGPGYAFLDAWNLSVTSAGDLGLSLKLGPDSFSANTPVTGLSFNTSGMPLREGEAITAPGVTPGTTLAPLDATCAVAMNDNNVFLVACRIVEGGATKNAILKVAGGPAGTPATQTLVAKVGGPVGAGPDTWTTLSTAPGTVALNNYGMVIFSGATASGIDGLYRHSPVSPAGNGFVARAGGAAPGGGAWLTLVGAPVDMNASGAFAFRGVVGGTGPAIWTEVGDAGETFSSSFAFTANSTIGGGPLTEIVGTLSTDHDVDVYFISIGDPALQTQEPFSATTVPAPGFTGANFDTVLYLFKSDPNLNGNTRVPLGRCDDSAPGVMQSTLTTASLSTRHTPGTKYFLAISTPKARAFGGTFPAPSDLWIADPARLVVANGVLHWVDPSEGQIARASLATGQILTPLQVGTIPQQTTEGQSVTGDAPLLDQTVAAYDAGPASKLFLFRKAFGEARIRRCDLDGSNVIDVVNPAFGTRALTVDNPTAKLYWSALTGGTGKVFSANLDGTGVATVLDTGDVNLITALAVDSLGGWLYWFDASNGILFRSPLAGGAAQNVVPLADVAQMSADVPGRRLYFTTVGSSKVGVINLATGLPAADLAPAVRPSGVAAGSDGNVYWSTPYDRLVRRAPAAGGAAADWLTLPKDVGERPGDGPAAFDTFGSFVKLGTPVNTPLPYRIKLTGATFQNAAAVICRNNTTRVVGAGDVLPATAPNAITTVGAIGSGVRITDRGAVAWRGRWTTPATRTGLFIGTDLVFADNSTASGVAGPIGTMPADPQAMDVAPNGLYAVASAFNGSFSGGGSNCVRVTFAAPVGCPADFNGVGGVELLDIFAFLQDWFAGDPAADFNAQGGVDLLDIFAFLTAWFSGC